VTNRIGGVSRLRRFCFTWGGGAGSMMMQAGLK